MADKSTQLVLEALSRAVADPTGVPLHGPKGGLGLFPATSAAKQAAQRCKDEGYLHVVGTASKGKTTQELCALTEKGLAFLLTQVSPKQVLEDFVRALEARQTQAGELLTVARQMQAGLDALKATAEKVLQQVKKPAAPAAPPGPAPSGNGATTWQTALLSYLARWQASEDCPLPELFREARTHAPALTIGQFHDELRRLHDQHQVYLHPWTGPLYDIPEPPYSLLIGHEIAYYVSIRK